MKTLIIEDEKAALRNLKAVINEVSAGLEIIGETDSIVDTIEWFQTHPMPELVFMDIHLADGSAFEVFEHVEVKCPIILLLPTMNMLCGLFMSTALRIC